jgi:hypothetical protein
MAGFYRKKGKLETKVAQSFRNTSKKRKIENKSDTNF